MLCQKAENHVCIAFLVGVKNSFAQLNTAKNESEYNEAIEKQESLCLILKCVAPILC
jgi:hypothetical protein